MLLLGKLFNALCATWRTPDGTAVGCGGKRETVLVWQSIL